MVIEENHKINVWETTIFTDSFGEGRIGRWSAFIGFVSWAPPGPCLGGFHTVGGPLWCRLVGSPCHRIGLRGEEILLPAVGRKHRSHETRVGTKSAFPQVLWNSRKKETQFYKIMRIRAFRILNNRLGGYILPRITICIEISIFFKKAGNWSVNVSELSISKHGKTLSPHHG